MNKVQLLSLRRNVIDREFSTSRLPSVTVAKSLSERLQLEAAFTLQRLQYNQTTNRIALASPKHVKKGHKLAARKALAPQAAQGGTAPEGEAKKAEAAEVLVGTFLIRFPPNLSASVMQRQLAAAYGPGMLVRASDSLPLVDNDTVVAGSYDYIREQHVDEEAVMKEMTANLSKMKADAEEIIRLCKLIEEKMRTRRRRWFYF